MLTELKEHAWKYFQLHAGQRMSVFNFFAIMSTLLTTALATSFTEKFNCPAIGMISGIGLVVIAFVFWKLDQRIRFLIKLAETELTAIECEGGNDKKISDSPQTLFLIERIETENKRRELCWWKPQTWHLKYSECFGIAYILFAFIGIVGTVSVIFRN
jgi:hypothetical protein